MSVWIQAFVCFLQDLQFEMEAKKVKRSLVQNDAVDSCSFPTRVALFPTVETPNAFSWSLSCTTLCCITLNNKYPTKLKAQDHDIHMCTRVLLIAKQSNTSNVRQKIHSYINCVAVSF